MDPARERQTRMEVRVFRSHAEHQSADRAYWAGLSAGERVLLAWTLSEELWRLQGGELPDEPGLRRSVARVRRP